MKIAVNRENLLHAISAANQVILARTTLDVLKCVEIVANDESVTIRATNLEISLAYQLTGATVAKFGSAIIKLQDLIDVTRELPDKVFSIETTSASVNITTSAGIFEIQSTTFESYPFQMPTVDRWSTIQGDALRKLIKRTIFAVDVADGSYALGAVHAEFEPGAVSFVAADRKRLVVQRCPIVVGSDLPEAGALLSPKSLSLIDRVIGDRAGDVQFVCSDNLVCVAIEKATVWAKLVEGRFPKWNDYFSFEYCFRVPLSVGPLMTFLRQASVMTSDDSRGVDFMFDSGNVRASSVAISRGRASLSMPIGYDGKSFGRCLIPQQIIEAIKPLSDSEELFLDVPKNDKAGLAFRARDDFQFLVMPLWKE